MTEATPDPNLSAPQEANTTKHINFAEVEEDGSDNSSNDDDDEFKDSPTRKAWKELREDEANNK